MAEVCQSWEFCIQPAAPVNPTHERSDLAATEMAQALGWMLAAESLTAKIMLACG